MARNETQVEKTLGGNGLVKPYVARLNGELLRTKGGVARCFKTEAAAQKALDEALAARSMNIRIRRCNGNKDAWASVCGKNDFLMATSYSLDSLIATITLRHPGQQISIAA